MPPLTDNPTFMGLLGGAVIALAPRVFAWMTRGRALARAATLKEIADHTAVMERQMARIESDNAILRSENEKMRNHIQMLDFYVDELEAALRRANVPIPDPPWSRRRGGERHP